MAGAAFSFLGGSMSLFCDGAVRSYRHRRVVVLVSQWFGGFCVFQIWLCSDLFVFSRGFAPEAWVLGVFCRGLLLRVVVAIFVVLGVFRRSEVLVLYCSASAMLQIFFSTSVLVGSGCLFCCRRRPPFGTGCGCSGDFSGSVMVLLGGLGVRGFGSCRLVCWFRF